MAAAAKAKGKKSKKEKEEEERKVREDAERKERDAKEKAEEEESLRREKAEKERVVQAQRAREEEIARLTEEADAARAVLRVDKESLAREKSPIAAKKMWEKYVGGSSRPDSSDPRQINTYLSTLRSEKGAMATLEDVLEESATTEDVVRDIEYQLSLAMQARDNIKVAESLAFISSLRACTAANVDAATADILSHYEKHPIVDKQQKFDCATEDLSVGLWINLQSRNFRRYNVVFEGLGLSFDIPKQLAHTFPTVIRVIRSAADRASMPAEEEVPAELSPDEVATRMFSDAVLNVASELHEVWREKRRKDGSFEARTKSHHGQAYNLAELRLGAIPPALCASTYTEAEKVVFWNSVVTAPNDYLVLGGTIEIDLLTLPDPSTSVKGWSLREVTALSSTVARQDYPPLSSAASAADLAFIVRYKIPPGVIMSDAPMVGWWNAAAKAWSEEGISEVSFNLETRQISFHTLHLKPSAVLQPRTADMPYKSWKLAATSPSQTLYTIESSRYTFVFAVSSAGVVLLEPKREEEVAHLIEADPVEPAVLLRRLQACGINLMPVQSDAKKLSSPITPKTGALEKESYRSIGRVSPVSTVTSHPANQPLGEHMALVSLGEMDFLDGSEKLPRSLVALEREEVVPTHVKSYVVTEGEGGAFKLKAGELSHAFLHVTVESVFSASAREVLADKVSLTHVEHIQSMLLLTRPLSFC